MDVHEIVTLIDRSWEFNAKRYPVLAYLEKGNANKNVLLAFRLQHVLKHQAKCAEKCWGMARAIYPVTQASVHELVKKILFNSIKLCVLLHAEPRLDLSAWDEPVHKAPRREKDFVAIVRGQQFEQVAEQFAFLVFKAFGTLEQVDHHMVLLMTTMVSNAYDQLSAGIRMATVTGYSQDMFEECVRRIAREESVTL